MTERILYLPIFEQGAIHATQIINKRGLFDALCKYGEVKELDYLAVARDALPDLVFHLIETWQPTILFTQLHAADCLTPAHLRAIRERWSNVLRINWNGDAWSWSLTKPEVLELCRELDLQLVINGAVLPIYAENGVHAKYWQFGYEAAVGELPEVPSYDVVYLANCYGEQRPGLGKLLRSMPVSTGIYGSGWPDADGNCTYDFGMGEALYRNAKIAISDNGFPDLVGYVSNRPLQAMVAGCFVLQQYVNEWESYMGFRDGEHYIGFRTFDELPDLIAYWLLPEQAERRAQIASAAQRFVFERHSFDYRCRQLFDELLPELRIGLEHL